MAKGVKPECKYGHGPMEAYHSPDEESRGLLGGAPSQYAAVRYQNGLMQLGAGFVFEIWTCPKCSYIEFHDVDL